MTDPFDDVLRLVAEGRLTAEEAAPILDALGGPGASPAGPADELEASTAGDRPTRALRVEVTEGGRQVVNLRIPLALGRMALDHIPGLSGDHVARIREALDHNLSGPIVAVDDDGGSVRIVLE